MRLIKTSKIWTVIVLTMFAFNGAVLADTYPLQLSLDPQHSGDDQPLGIFSDIADDIWETVSSPADWKDKDWLKFGGIVAGAALLYTVDEKIMSWVQDNKSGFTRAVAKIAENFGSAYKVMAGIGLLYLTNLSGDREKAKETADLLLRGAAATLSIVYVLKVTFGRERPAQYNTTPEGVEKKTKGHARKFHWFKFPNNYRSFPSGHSALAFSMATVISQQHKTPGKTNYVGILSYTLATLTALSRVHDEKHWPSDIFVGAALGHFIARYIVKRQRRENELRAFETYLNGPRFTSPGAMNSLLLKDSEKGVRLLPILDLNGFGMSMNIQF